MSQYQAALNRAETHERRGEIGRAVRSYHAALTAVRCTPDGGATRQEVDCLIRLCHVVRFAGRYRWAESLLLRAIERVHEHMDGDSGLALEAMNELAVLYKSVGRFDEAATLYHSCLSIIAVRQSGDSH